MDNCIYQLIEEVRNGSRVTLDSSPMIFGTNTQKDLHTLFPANM